MAKQQLQLAGEPLELLLLSQTDVGARLRFIELPHGRCRLTLPYGAPGHAEAKLPLGTLVEYPAKRRATENCGPTKGQWRRRCEQHRESSADGGNAQAKHHPVAPKLAEDGNRELLIHLVRIAIRRDGQKQRRYVAGVVCHCG